MFEQSKAKYLISLVIVSKYFSNKNLIFILRYPKNNTTEKICSNNYERKVAF